MLARGMFSGWVGQGGAGWGCCMLREAFGLTVSAFNVHCFIMLS